MFRLMFALLPILWSAVLDTAGGGSGGGEEGEGDSSGEGGGQSFTLTASELEQRTNKAAEDRAKELANTLGVDLSNTADVKALIEAGRGSLGAADQQSAGGDERRQEQGKPGEEQNIEEQIAAALKPFTDRLAQIESTEQQRQQAAATQTRDEKLAAALKEANVREDRLEAARAVALASGAGVKLGDDGELTGSKEAIEATKKALPEAFRGDGDTGIGADASGNKTGDRKPATLSEALQAHYSSKAS